jgi:hypothetical protein
MACLTVVTYCQNAHGIDFLVSFDCRQQARIICFWVLSKELEAAMARQPFPTLTMGAQ